MASNNKHFVVKYFECRHNYAASSMGHVLDGCGEFFPTGPPETPESFICAACHCHRNFHRKMEVEMEDRMELPILSIDHYSHGIPSPTVIVDGSQHPYLERPHHPRQTFNKNKGFAIPAQGTEMDGGEIEVDEQSGFKRKRLSDYQKERVLAFAEEVMGWRWTKYNDKVIPFCDEIGITPSYLKNWMDNNRRKIGKHIRGKRMGCLKLRYISK
ncbi:unnamed protein product [Withania somnifera]